MDNSQSAYSDIAQTGSNTEQFLGKLVVKLETRIQSLELKVNSMSKVVRLLQQYTENKDKQYEKQTQNIQHIYKQLSENRSFQTKYQQLSQNCQQNTINISCCSLKLQKIENTIDYWSVLQSKLSDSVQQLSAKVQKIETVLLQQLKRNTISNCELLTKSIYPNRHQLQQLSCKLNQLQLQHTSQSPRTIDKLNRLNKKLTSNSPRSTEGYAALEQKRIDIKNHRSPLKNSNSPLKRIRSK